MNTFTSKTGQPAYNVTKRKRAPMLSISRDHREKRYRSRRGGESDYSVIRYDNSAYQIHDYESNATAYNGVSGRFTACLREI